MKSARVSVLLFLVAGTVSLHAQEAVWQKKDSRSEVLENVGKAGGVYYMYEFDLPAPTPAPKGYKPFYISHIGRHGARYGLRENIYEKINDFLETAHAEGRLTDEGERLYVHYKDFYPHVAHRGGELTQKGQQQLRQIATKVYRDYPDVFRGPTHAEVVSTNSHRVLISMLSFLDELAELDRDFEFGLDAGVTYMDKLLPISSQASVYKTPKPFAEEVRQQQADFNAPLLKKEEFAARFFKDKNYVHKNYGYTAFQKDLFTIITDIQCLDYEPEYAFEDIFSPEDAYNLWLTDNYNHYIRFGRSPLTDKQPCMSLAYVLKDFIDKADEDILSGKTNLRLRFSHDSAMMPLMSFMQVNSFGAEIADPAEVADYWRNFEIPMGCNFQLIFFRSRKNPDILVKPVYNGREARLPFPSVSGPFYSWDAFKAYYGPMVDDAIRFMENYD